MPPPGHTICILFHGQQRLCPLPHEEARQRFAAAGAAVDEAAERVEYVHLLFDRHEVILAEGTPTESLFTGEVRDQRTRDYVEGRFG